jgi:hypothetical protein
MKIPFFLPLLTQLEHVQQNFLKLMAVVEYGAAHPAVLDLATPMVTAYIL